ncbi:MFS transporter [Pseudomonas sp. D2-30]|uniref:MFS transporter n=1 Tax=unclassified Pseudomonas TaxID=196821 RepID=UPI003DA9FEFD
MRRTTTRLGLAAVLTIFVGQFAAYTYLSPYLLNKAAVTPMALSAILLGFGIAVFLGNLAGGWAVAKNAARTLIFSALLMGIPMFLLAAGVTPKPMVIALVMLWGLGFGLLPIAMQTWLFSMAPDRLEAMGAIFVSSAQISIGLGALAGGLAVDHLGVLSAIAMGGAFAVAAAALTTISQARTVKIPVCATNS